MFGLCRILRSSAPRAASLALVAALAAGCDDIPVTTVTYQVDNAWQFAQPAMPLLIEIHGQPYATDGHTLERIVTEAMTRAVTWHDSPRFTVDPASAGSPSVRIVMTFNPTRGASGEANCGGTLEAGTADPGGAVRVLATFCSAGRVLANVEGRIAHAGDAGDDRFPALVRQITRDMFQQQRQ